MTKDEQMEKNEKMTKNEAIGKEKVEFAKTLAGISSTLAAICLAILIFSLGEKNVILIIPKLLWGAVILFAIASFTCLDVLMDAISDMDGNYTLKEIHKDYLVFDKRITDFEGAVLMLFGAWLIFTFAMFFIGKYICMPLPLNLIGVGLMIFFAVLFITRKPDPGILRSKLTNRDSK